MCALYAPDDVVVDPEPSTDSRDCDSAQTKRAWIVLGSRLLAALAALFGAIAAVFSSLPYLIRVANWILGLLDMPRISLSLPTLRWLLEQLLQLHRP